MPNLAQTLPQEIQTVLPMMAGLNLEQRAYLASFLLNPPAHRASRLGANALGVTHVSDDFDDELGDDFWLGDDTDNLSEKAAWQAT
ncbi:hypothetical protein B0181_02235 [Moraxella caviae]|uniref:Uncharacterized protein n=1 Tax=Moraxella caviae TaxID=34060 RepID=A0A1T0A822_9GAMM|nr:hypothetical protein [Moraxella caviae]OOR91873.1 hypothetical protein B0181_02235 [Moraxella caviae]STZ09722.1 Uncharacterised protein [Moraxella caviae]